MKTSQKMKIPLKIRIKMIRIETCNNCPHAGYDGDEICMFKSTSKDLPKFPIIPKWCPLENLGP